MAGILGQDRDFDTHKSGLVSPWRIPIPLDEDLRIPVVVYFFSDRWIPISCFSFAEAMALYRKALSLGKQILVYPPQVNPYTQLLSEKSLEFIPESQEVLKAS